MVVAVHLGQPIDRFFFFRGPRFAFDLFIVAPLTDRCENRRTKARFSSRLSFFISRG